MKKKSHFLFHDFLVISFGIIVAILLVKTDVISNLLTATKEIEIISIFVSGMFFTSIFTTAPAVVALAEISLHIDSLLALAFFGGLGAMVVDVILFEFVKNNFSEHIMANIKKKRLRHKLQHIFSSKLFRVFSFVIGGLIIASPLPDELGISLMGLSKTRVSLFMILSFIFNFIGIFFVGLAARVLF